MSALFTRPLKCHFGVDVNIRRRDGRALATGRGATRTLEGSSRQERTMGFWNPSTSDPIFSWVRTSPVAPRGTLRCLAEEINFETPACSEKALLHKNQKLTALLNLPAQADCPGPASVEAAASRRCWKVASMSNVREYDVGIVR